MQTILESKLTQTLNCATVKTKETSKTVTIVAKYINIEDESDLRATIVDLFAKYHKSTGKLTLEYEIPLLDYKEDVTRTRHVERKRVKRKRSYGKVHKTNGEPRYIEVKGDIRGYENDMTRTVLNPAFEEWDEPNVHTWMEDVEDVTFNTHVNKTFVQDFNEKNAAIRKFLENCIMDAIKAV